jgi:hypothetical protein
VAIVDVLTLGPGLHVRIGGIRSGTAEVHADGRLGPVSNPDGHVGPDCGRRNGHPEGRRTRSNRRFYSVDGGALHVQTDLMEDDLPKPGPERTRGEGGAACDRPRVQIDGEVDGEVLNVDRAVRRVLPGGLGLEVRGLGASNR